VWKFEHSTKKTAIGNKVGYQLVPHGNASPLLAEDDIVQIRGSFTDYQLWVTPRNTREKHCAGWYTYNNGTAQGLPEWTKQNRNILDTDIVAWYTVGMHHVTRQEDYPILPATSQFF